jgi:hypothetical protein
MFPFMQTATESTNPRHRQGRPRRTRHELGVRAIKDAYRLGGSADSLKNLMRAVAEGPAPAAATAQRWLANKGTR